MWYPCQKCNYQGKHIINVHNDLQNFKYCSYIVDNSDTLDQLMDQDHGRDSQHNLVGDGTALKSVFGNAYILITLHYDKVPCFCLLVS